MYGLLLTGNRWTFNFRFCKKIGLSLLPPSGGNGGSVSLTKFLADFADKGIWKSEPCPNFLFLSVFYGEAARAKSLHWNGEGREEGSCSIIVLCECVPGEEKQNE